MRDSEDNYRSYVMTKRRFDEALRRKELNYCGGNVYRIGDLALAVLRGDGETSSQMVSPVPQRDGIPDETLEAIGGDPRFDP